MARKGRPLSAGRSERRRLARWYLGGQFGDIEAIFARTLTAFGGPEMGSTLWSGALHLAYRRAKEEVFTRSLICIELWCLASARRRADNAYIERRHRGIYWEYPDHDTRVAVARLLWPVQNDMDELDRECNELWRALPPELTQPDTIRAAAAALGCVLPSPGVISRVGATVYRYQRRYT